MLKPPLSKELVRQKLKRIVADVKQISAIVKKTSYEQLITDEVASTTVERRLERSINRSIDINLHLIRVNKIPPPDDYTQSFFLLAKHKILSPKLATALAPCVGTRNILVHEYDDLNTAQFYQALQKATQLFPKYVQAIEHYLDKF